MSTNKRAMKTSEAVQSARQHLARVKKQAYLEIEAAEEFLAKAEHAHAIALKDGWV